VIAPQAESESDSDAHERLAKTLEEL